jgi:hypothetical protein
MERVKGKVLERSNECFPHNGLEKGNRNFVDVEYLGSLMGVPNPFIPKTQYNC